VREVVRWSSTVSRSRARSFVAINHQSTLGSRRLQFSSLWVHCEETCTSVTTASCH